MTQSTKELLDFVQEIIENEVFGVNIDEAEKLVKAVEEDTIDMESFISIGDKVGFTHKTGFYGKYQTIKTGVVIDISNEGNTLYKIQYKTESGKNSSCTRTEEEVISFYDLLEEI